MFTGTSALNNPTQTDNHPPRTPYIPQFLSTSCRALSQAVQSAALFIIHFCRSPAQVGAICPSSKYLARAIASKALPCLEMSPPRYILEVGPGTGALTSEIVKALREDDHLHLVEFDPEFVRILLLRYRNDPRIEVHKADFVQWYKTHTEQPGFQRYNVIISGLPLNIFSLQQVHECLCGLKSLTTSDSTITYFEYPGLMNLKKIYFQITRAHKAYKKVIAIEQAKKNFCSSMQCTHQIVHLNTPPARVVHCQMRGSSLVHT